MQSLISNPQKIVLAPMDGLTDTYARHILTSVGGYDLCVTEFLRVTQSLYPQKVFYRSFPELSTASRTSSGTPIFLQLLGSDAHCMAENAAKAASLGALGIDLNFGCPAKTVNKHQGGAVLLNNPERIFKIVSSVREAVPSDIPVTAKMRLGFADKCLAKDNAQAIEAAGATWVTIHARTKKEGYRPPAYWSVLADIKPHLHIPIIANGEIWSVEDYNQCKLDSQCSSVMLGRGAMVLPSLARQIKSSIHTQQTNRLSQAALSWPEVVKLLHQFYQLMLDAPQFDDKYIPARLKLWVKWLMGYYTEAELIFNQLKKCNHPKTSIDIIISTLTHD